MMNRDQIDLYEDGGRKLRKAIEGLDERDFAEVPVPGKWSIGQLVCHLADADLVLTERLKRVIAEDKPQLLAFDESLWAKNLHYDLQPTQDLAELFALNRRLTANLLRLLPPEAFFRTGVHSERGEQTVEQIFGFALRHLDHHLKFLYEKREAMGKLLW